MKKGKFIVLEGTDGSGKTVQFRHLVERLKEEGVPYATVDFPRYDKPSSYFIKEYLNGAYGSWKEVGAKKASLFYALDRYDAAGEIREALDKGKLVIANRYATSNMGHQGAKISDPIMRGEFFAWLHELEYVILGIPRPDLVLFLHVPAAIAHQLVDKKGEREYLKGAKRDIHEKDISHLTQAEQSYQQMAQMYPESFRTVECVEEEKLLPVGDIADKIWDIVSGQISS